MTLFRSCVLVVIFALGLLSSSAEAARLAMRSSSEGGGTLVNNGTGDVGTTNGSSFGFTTLWSDMGLAGAEDLLVFGGYEGGAGIDPFADLTGQRLVATVPFHPRSLPSRLCHYRGGHLRNVGAGRRECAECGLVWQLALAARLDRPSADDDDGGLAVHVRTGPQDVIHLDAIILLVRRLERPDPALTAAVLFPPNNGLAQGAPVFDTPNP